MLIVQAKAIRPIFQQLADVSKRCPTSRRQMLTKHHGVSKDRFPPYLKEPKFRYCHRTGDLFDQAAKNLCDLSQKPD